MDQHQIIDFACEAVEQVNKDLGSKIVTYVGSQIDPDYNIGDEKAEIDLNFKINNQMRTLSLDCYKNKDEVLINGNEILEHLGIYYQLALEVSLTLMENK